MPSHSAVQLWLPAVISCYYYCCSLAALGLVSLLFRPVGGQNVFQLDLTTLNGFEWTASLPNGSLSISANVPGGIYTDVDRFGAVFTDGPPLYRFNDLNYRWVALNDWHYQLDFNVDPVIVGQQGVFLVLHGVDTVTDVFLNGIHLATTDNMFVRYKFNVRYLLKSDGNQVRVHFRSAVTYARDGYEQQLIDYVVPPRCVPPEYQGECHANFIRKMQASFGWDWGPAFPSMGLWRGVALEAYKSLMLRDIYVETTRSGDGTGDWQLDLKMHCETTGVGPYSGTWTVTITDKAGQLVHQLMTNDTFSAESSDQVSVPLERITIAADQIEAWMPNGYGQQTLYRLSVSYVENGVTAFTKDINIGFRTIDLVENDLATGGRTFYIEVNKVPVFLKGSNWIPADILPELVTESYVRTLLTACRDANMNSLRVWGGGIYELDAFYQIADELGILIWQDFMFACSMYPTQSSFLESVSLEVKQQVRRLQHHPSLVLWAGNNENEAALRGNWYGTVLNFELYRRDYIILYVDTVRAIVQREDPTRPFVVSSPSNGKESEEEGYIAKNPYNDLYGDTHYYNYYANSWNASTYPNPRMSTEYGFQALPSVHAWSTAADSLNDDDWSYDGNLLSHRQHHPLGNFEMELQVSSRLGEPRTTTVRQKFLDMIYLTQMHQAQAIKTETEHYRRMRYQLTDSGAGLTMAALYWQLNDIWQAPSWASIEYGGRWKPLHYFATNFFAPLVVIFTELSDGSVAAFVHFDRKEDLQVGILQIAIRSWDQLEPISVTNVPIYQNMIVGEPAWNQPLRQLLNQTGCTRETCFISSSLVNADGADIAPDNYYLLTSFPNVDNLQKANVQVIDVGEVFVSSRSQWSVNVTLSSNAVAAFVWLDTLSDRQGTFSTNGFLLTDRNKTVSFFSEAPIISNEFRSDLKLTHLAEIIMI